MAQERIENKGDNAKSSPVSSYQAPDVDATMSSATEASSKVHVIHGANERYYPLQGKTVGSVRKSLREIHNIPGDADAFVQGEKVADDHILNGGCTLEFVKTSGVKGKI